ERSLRASQQHRGRRLQVALRRRARAVRAASGRQGPGSDERRSGSLAPARGPVAAQAAAGRPSATIARKGDVIADKQEKIEMEGEIIESLRNRMFKIRLDNGHEMLGYTAGRMKRYRIMMLLGDRVRIELSPYDLDRGRIVYRLR